jgi:hypothetical protein
MANESNKVGYKNPPPEHRWKKGQSGNPKGGSGKKPKPERAILENMLGKKRTVQTPNGPEKLDGLELVALRLFNDALAGKPRQLKLLLDRMDANGIGRQEASESLSEADARIADEYLKLFRAQVGGAGGV